MHFMRPKSDGIDQTPEHNEIIIKWQTAAGLKLASSSSRFAKFDWQNKQRCGSSLQQCPDRLSIDKLPLLYAFALFMFVVEHFGN